MLFRAILFGLIGAIIVAVPRWFWLNHKEVDWENPLLIVFLTLFMVLLRELNFSRETPTPKDIVDASTQPANTGFSDILIQMLTPAKRRAGEKWGIRSISSFFLSLFGGATGPEGAAIEFNQSLGMATRTSSVLWYQERRKADIASVIVGAFTAAFGAPFAAILLLMELRLGGISKTPIVSALVAFIATQVFENSFQLVSFDIGALIPAIDFEKDLSFANREIYAGLAMVLLISPIAGSAVSWFVEWAQKSFTNLFAKRVWLAILIGGFLLFLVVQVHPQGHVPSPMIIKGVLETHPDLLSAGYLILSQVLILTLVIAVFLSSGIFWPIFGLGGLIGYFIAISFPGISENIIGIYVLAGAAGFFASVLSLPLTGAVIALEMTGDIWVFIPCLVVAVGADQLRKLFMFPSLIERNLSSRKIVLEEGQDLHLLDNLKVQDSMVRDYTIVYEHLSLDNLNDLLVESKYPYLPVVNKKGVYLGLLSADNIHRVLELKRHSKAAGIVEAKDLLYRNQFEVDTVKMGDSLQCTTGIFRRTPVVPVLNDNDEVVGMLFAHHVKIAYEREVARRTLSFHHTEKKFKLLFRRKSQEENASEKQASGTDTDLTS